MLNNATFHIFGGTQNYISVQAISCAVRFIEKFRFNVALRKQSLVCATKQLLQKTIFSGGFLGNFLGIFVQKKYVHEMP